jgi:hypothetical protein
MIVVEGPDGGGKTTLIRYLTVAFRIPVAPRVVSKEAEALIDLKVWVEQDNEMCPELIYDRHRLISEPIYGPILRHRTEPGFDDPDWLGAQLQDFYDRHMFHIFCIPPKEVIWGNIKDDESNKVVKDKWARIYDLYVARAGLDRLLTYTHIYDYTQDDGPHSLNALVSHLNHYKNSRVSIHG